TISPIKATRKPFFRELYRWTSTANRAPSFSWTSAPELFPSRIWLSDGTPAPHRRFYPALRGCPVSCGILRQINAVSVPFRVGSWRHDRRALHARGFRG